MPHLNTNGAKIYYELAEQPGAPWLVLSHSLGANRSMWDPQLPALLPHFNLLRYDNRGHGQSSVPPGPYTMEQLASDVLALCDHLGALRFNFCGLSIGGLVGQWLSAHAADRLDRLVLCNTASKIGSSHLWAHRIKVVQDNGLDPLSDGSILRWFTPSFAQTQPSTVERIKTAFLATPRAGYIASCAVLRDFDAHDLLQKISTPTLVVCGKYDPLTTVQDGQFLMASIKSARMLQLEAAHLSNVEAAETFNRALLEFLQRDKIQVNL